MGGEVIHNIGTLVDKYERDAMFAIAVDHLYNLIHGTKLTPEEMRQAVHYASWKYEMQSVKRNRIEVEDGKKD
jgi:hypothetical protein